MSDELGAAGAMATAGLVAGVIEGREAQGAGEGKCLNCGAQLQGAYCHACGQAGHANRRLSHVIEEVFHGLLHLDTKVWRTLPMVVFRPGTLTRNYTYGKRARYVSPLAMFLLTIFLMFFAFSFVEAPVNMNTFSERRADAVENLAEARAGLAEAQAELAQESANPSEDGPPGLAVGLARQAVQLAEAEVSRREAAIARIDTIAAASESEAQTAAPGAAPEAQGTASTSASGEQTWQEEMQESARSGEIHVNTGWPRADENIKRALENPDLALYKVQEAANKFSFLLVPISLPFFALLFLWKRGLTLYDHVVYALYALSFASILFVLFVLGLQSPLTTWAAPWLVGLGLPVHTYFRLKGAYALGWWSALWRSLFMLTFALLALCIFIFIVLVLGIGLG